MAAAGQIKKPTMARQRHIVAYEWALAQPMFPTRLQMSEIMKTAKLSQSITRGWLIFWRNCEGLTGSTTVALRKWPPEQRRATKDGNDQRCEIAGRLDLDVKVFGDVDKGGHDGRCREGCHHGVEGDQEQVRDLLPLRPVVGVCIAHIWNRFEVQGSVPLEEVFAVLIGEVVDSILSDSQSSWSGELVSLQQELTLYSVWMSRGFWASSNFAVDGGDAFSALFMVDNGVGVNNFQVKGGPRVASECERGSSESCSEHGKRASRLVKQRLGIHFESPSVCLEM